MMIGLDELCELMAEHAAVRVKVGGRVHDATLTGDHTVAQSRDVRRLRNEYGVPTAYAGLRRGMYVEVQMTPRLNAKGEPVGGYSEIRLVHVEDVRKPRSSRRKYRG